MMRDRPKIRHGATEWFPTNDLRRKRQWISDDRAEHVIEQRWERFVTDEYGTEKESEWREPPLFD